MNGEFEFRVSKLEAQMAKLRQLLVVPTELPFKKLSPGAQLPAKSGELEACYDITCVMDKNFIAPQTVLADDLRKKFGIEITKPFMLLQPNHSYLFHTGIACAIPEGRAMYLWDRSGMGAKKNVHRLAGVIDCTYRGEWRVSLINLSPKHQIIQAGDRIVQAQYVLVIPGEPVWVDELPDSYRGEKGFASTGD